MRKLLYFVCGLGFGSGTFMPSMLFYILPGFSYSDLLLIIILLYKLITSNLKKFISTYFVLFFMWLFLTTCANYFNYEFYIRDIFYFCKIIYLYLVYLCIIKEFNDDEVLVFRRGICFGLSVVVLYNLMSGQGVLVIGVVNIPENPNVTAMLAVAGLILTALEHNQTIKLILWVVFVTGAWLSYSKAGWLCMIPLLFYYFNTSKVNRIFKYVMLIFTTFFISYKIPIAQIPTFINDKIIQSERTLPIRIDLMWAAIDVAVKHPIFGVGIKNTYLIDSYSTHKYGMVRGDNSHNMFFDVLAGSGFVGLVLFMNLIVNYFIRSINLSKIRSFNQDNIYSLSSIFCLILYLNTNVMFLSQPHFWAVMAFLTRFNKEKK